MPSDWTAGAVHAGKTWVYRALAWLVATTLTALIGPFATYLTFGFVERFAYWGGLIAGSILLGLATHAALLRLITRDRLLTDLLGAVVQSLVLGPAIWLVNLRIMRFDVGKWFWLVEHVLVVFVVCLCIVFARDYLRRAARRTVVPVAPRLARHLQDDLGGEVLRVSADDHALRVFTAKGEGRVRMRFRDALDELAHLPGLRIHRSHWVALDALSEVRQDGRRTMAVLTDGTELPVSRAYLDDLRAAGRLD